MNEALSYPATLLRRMRQSLPTTIGDIETLVSAESPSSDLAAICASAAVVAKVGTIAAEAECFVDARAWTLSEQQRIDHAMKSLRPHLDGARLDVTCRAPRPPMTSGSSKWQFTRAQRAADRLGPEPLTGESVGGASDGNLTAAAGTPTLDGLGAVGSGAHAQDEHVLVHHLPGRTALLALLIADALSSTHE
jgi:glutamate carboxypeptidase